MPPEPAFTRLHGFPVISARHPATLQGWPVESGKVFAFLMNIQHEYTMMIHPSLGKEANKRVIPGWGPALAAQTIPLAGGGGFEPPSATPKAAVLPLDDPPENRMERSSPAVVLPGSFL